MWQRSWRLVVQVPAQKCTSKHEYRCRRGVPALGLAKASAGCRAESERRQNRRVTAFQPRSAMPLPGSRQAMA